MAWGGCSCYPIPATCRDDCGQYPLVAWSFGWAMALGFISKQVQFSGPQARATLMRQGCSCLCPSPSKCILQLVKQSEQEDWLSTILAKAIGSHRSRVY